MGLQAAVKPPEDPVELAFCNTDAFVLNLNLRIKLQPDQRKPDTASRRRIFDCIFQNVGHGFRRPFRVVTELHIPELFYDQLDPFGGRLRIDSADRPRDRRLDSRIRSLKLNHAVFQPGRFQKSRHQPLHFIRLASGMLQKFDSLLLLKLRVLQKLRIHDDIGQRRLELMRKV